jgi:hypothetical protein
MLYVFDPVLVAAEYSERETHVSKVPKADGAIVGARRKCAVVDESDAVHAVVVRRVTAVYFAAQTGVVDHEGAAGADSHYEIFFRGKVQVED